MSERKESTVETLIEQVSLLPYWVGVSAGLISYTVLHHFSDLTILNNSDIDQIDGLIVKQTIKIAAYFGQFFIPFVCFLGAYLSARKAARQGRFFSASRQNKTNSLRQLHLKEFKQLLTEYYKRKGFTIIDPPGGSEESAEIHLTKKSEYSIVHCKYWKRDLIGASLIREQYGMQNQLNADTSIMVVSGEFSQDAIEFADGKSIELVDGKQLNRILGSPGAIRHKSSVDCYLPMVMTMGCFMFFLIFLTSDLKNDSGSVAARWDKTPVATPQKDQQDLQHVGPEPPVLSDTSQEIQSETTQPVRAEAAVNHNIYTYTYKDKEGVFQTIASPIWLDYKIVEGRLHYFGKTTEERELAALLNDTNRNVSY